MSSYINRAQLQGVVGNDPELRYVGESGKAVCNVRLATTNRYKTAQGEYSEETEWHTVVGWEAVAERKRPTAPPVKHGSFMLSA